MTHRPAPTTPGAEPPHLPAPGTGGGSRTPIGQGSVGPGTKHGWARFTATGVVLMVVAAALFYQWRGHRAASRERGDRPSKSPDLEAYVLRPIGVMGTESVLKAVVPRGQGRRAEEALGKAEAALRDVEAHMSTWIDDTEVSLLNAAPAGKVVRLSGRTLSLLKLSRDLARQSGGAFDVTCRPIIELWKQAGRRNRLPARAELDAARDRCGWDKFDLLPGGASKKIAGAGVDLGGIAKGYAIDRAVDALIAGGALGGIVDVGGDVRCFGRRPGDGKWRIGVRDPFHVDKLLTHLAVGDAAVCTSGNYFRFVEIGGVRHSHIVDPRTGTSVDAAPSVTVVAPQATIADAWATALSVLGPDGIKLLAPEAHIEAMIVLGTPGHFTAYMTPGFEKLLAEPPEWKPVIVPAHAPRPASAPAKISKDAGDAEKQVDSG